MPSNGEERKNRQHRTRIRAIRSNYWSSARPSLVPAVGLGRPPTSIGDTAEKLDISHISTGRRGKRCLEWKDILELVAIAALDPVPFTQYGSEISECLIMVLE